jgi:hypothetical protein
MAGVVTQYLPVPQRYTGTGCLMTLPSFPLPKDVMDIEAAKYYIAEQFKVKPEFVARMGESYFTHIGVTPHRIYPFVVTDSRWAGSGFTHGVTQITPLANLGRLLYWDNCDSFIKVAAMACQHLMDSDLANKRDFDFKVAPKAQQATVTSGSVFGYSGNNSAQSTDDKHITKPVVDVLRNPHIPK